VIAARRWAHRLLGDGRQGLSGGDEAREAFAEPDDPGELDTPTD
jgi:hypothetical protein